MNASRRAPDARRATLTFRAFIRRDCTPIASHASQKTPRTSADAFVKVQARVRVPLAAHGDAVGVPASVAVDEPAQQRFGVLVDDRLLPAGEDDRPRVVIPGPWCGKRHGHCFEYELTATHPVFATRPALVP